MSPDGWLTRLCPAWRLDTGGGHEKQPASGCPGESRRIREACTWTITRWQLESRLNDLVAQRRTYRDHAQVTAFYAGLELVESGIVGAPRRRPENDADAATPTMAWCGVGRKPLAG